MERTVGVKPTSPVWKTRAQSLYHARIIKELATPSGVEPAAPVLETSTLPEHEAVASTQHFVAYPLDWVGAEVRTPVSRFTAACPAD